MVESRDGRPRPEDDLVVVRFVFFRGMIEHNLSMRTVGIDRHNTPFDADHPNRM